jgi:hypothetical protein
VCAQSLWEQPVFDRVVDAALLPWSDERGGDAQHVRRAARARAAHCTRRMLIPLRCARTQPLHERDLVVVTAGACCLPLRRKSPLAS